MKFMNLSDLESVMEEGGQVVFTVTTDNDKGGEKEVFEQEKNKNKTTAAGVVVGSKGEEKRFSFDQDLAATADASFADLTEVTQWLRLGMPLLAILIVSILQILLFYL